jgi:integrase
MGRKPSRNHNLPKGMRARHRPGGKTYFYLDTGAKPRKEIPLGSDYVLAVQEWAKLTVTAPLEDVVTFRYAAERYTRDIIPTKAPRTQADNLAELANLLLFFDNPPAPLNQIEPQHIRQYLDWRIEKARERNEAENAKRRAAGKDEIELKEGKTRANREKALFSHIWNYARERGLTALENPCKGVKGYKEKGRGDVYIDDQVYAAVYRHANQSLKDAMDMAFLTGQRPGDVLRMSEAHIKDDLLAVRQSKTSKALRIRLNDRETGQRNELGRKIDEIRARKRKQKVADIALICNRDGMRLTQSGLDNAYGKARIKAITEAEQSGNVTFAELIRGFCFMDLRAKAGTEKADSEGIVEAQRQLGHKNMKMTEHYVRRGDVVSPTK